MTGVAGLIQFTKNGDPRKLVNHPVVLQETGFGTPLDHSGLRASTVSESTCLLPGLFTGLTLACTRQPGPFVDGLA